jgi:BOP1NT (NUC169) domain
MKIDDRLDEFIKKSENPNWWRTVKDELNQRNIEITDEQLDIMRRIRTGKFVNKAMEDTHVVPAHKVRDTTRQVRVHPPHG